MKKNILEEITVNWSRPQAYLVCMKRFILLISLYCQLIALYHQVNHNQTGYYFYHLLIGQEWLMTWSFHSLKIIFPGLSCKEKIMQNFKTMLDVIAKLGEIATNTLQCKNYKWFLLLLLKIDLIRCYSNTYLCLSSLNIAWQDRSL